MVERNVKNAKRKNFVIFLRGEGGLKPCEGEKGAGGEGKPKGREILILNMLTGFAICDCTRQSPVSILAFICSLCLQKFIMILPGVTQSHP
jgi:hypothetical protein